MEIVGIKAAKGKTQFLKVGQVYNVTEEIGNLAIKAGRAELKGAKKAPKKETKKTK